jgi:hypothetical protein
LRSSAKTRAIGLCLILMLGLSSAAFASEFGSKVQARDGDIGIYLEDFNPPASGPAITWWDCGAAPGLFDDEDVLYMDFQPLGVVSSSDIRLTPYGSYNSGSKVTEKDNDIGQDLLTIDCPIVYANLFGGPGYDLSDPVYIKTQYPLIQPGILTTNDVRLTSMRGACAGSRVHDSDPDFGKPTVTLYSPPYASPAAGPAATIRFFNANGNLQANNYYSLYDLEDAVYLDITNVPDYSGGSFGVNSPNNVRMSE